MGILGFQKFQNDVVGGSIKIKIIDKIVEWKTTHPDQQPIIVIRLKEILLSVIQLNIKAAFFGGSHRYYHEQLDNFFKQFHELNVKLVFFGGGTKEKGKLTKLAIKTDEDYRKFIQLLKHVDNTNELKLCSRPELRVTLGLYEEGIGHKYGEYIFSTGCLNKDIVKYTRQNENVIAILANDSDFLLYNLGSVEYWNCGIERLNFNEMTTMFYSQKATFEHVKLTPHQFHVMVAIAGVILDEPKKHCYRVSKKVFKQKNPGSIQIIESICEIVRNNVPAEEEKPNFGAWTTFTFVSHLEEYCWLIEKQFKKYDLGTKEPAISGTETVPDEEKILKKYKNIWAILNDEVIRVNHNFIDLSRWANNRNAMSYINLFVLVYKRALGIVLNSKKEETPKRQFMMKGLENERCKILPKTLAYAPFDVPTLSKLLDEDNNGDEELTKTKWSLLLWVLHLNFDDELVTKIRNLPRDILPVVITVLFLLWEHQITPMEADTIIMSENDVLNQSSGMEKVDYPEKVDGRTIRVAHIYVNTRVLINRCFQICGIDLFNIPVSFDGIHFHNLLNKFVEDTNLFADKKGEIKGFEIDAF